MQTQTKDFCLFTKLEPELNQRCDVCVPTTLNSGSST